MKNLNKDEKKGFELQIDCLKAQIQDFKNKLEEIKLTLENAEAIVAKRFEVVTDDYEIYKNSLRAYFMRNKGILIETYKADRESQINALNQGINMRESEIKKIEGIISTGLEKCDKCGQLIIQENKLSEMRLG